MARFCCPLTSDRGRHVAFPRMTESSELMMPRGGSSEDRVLSWAQHLALATVYHRVGVPTELKHTWEKDCLSLAINTHAQTQ